MKKNNRNKCLLLIAIAVTFIPAAAHAACSGPAGSFGTIEYFSAGGSSVFKFCDGTDWVPSGMWQRSGSDIHYSSGRVGIGVVPNGTENLSVLNDSFWNNSGVEERGASIDVWSGGGTAANNFTVALDVNSMTEGGGVSNDAVAVGAWASTGTTAAQDATGLYTWVRTYANDVGYGVRIENDPSGTGGTMYGVYIDLIDTDVTRYGVYQNSANPNYFAGNVGVGTNNPQSALHVPDGKYMQIEDNNAGAPPAADCDANTERGRMSIDTTNNRLYICNGATRGWDYVALTN